MRTYADCTVATATGDTVETSMGTIQLNAKAKRIIGVWGTAVGAATLTSGEAATGVFRLDSDSNNLAPAKFPLDVVSILTSGAIGFSPRIIPVDIPVTPLTVITPYITMDMAQTGALKGRVGIIYEGEN